MDSVIAAPSIEERLRNLEELGQEYNKLDEALHVLEQFNNDKEMRVRNLEQTDNDREARVMKLELQMRASESMQEEAVSKTNEKAEELTNAKADPAVSTLLDELEDQKATLHDITARLCQLEKLAASSLSTFTTHDIANALNQRLGIGEDLDPAVQLQLRVALGIRDAPLPTPAPTSIERGESIMSGATFVEKPPKAARGRPPKRRMEEPPENEPLLKHQRIRTSEATSSDASSLKSQPKRPQGRPRKYGDEARKSSSTSTTSSASGVAQPAPKPAPRPLFVGTPGKTKGTATKLTKTMLAERSANKQSTPEVGKNWRARMISGSTNNDADTEPSEVITPKKTIRLRGPANAANTEAKSDEPIAVATKSQRTNVSQINELKSAWHRASSFDPSGNPRPNSSTPKRKNATPCPNETTPQSQRLGLGLDSESPGRGNTSPGYRDERIHDLAALEESTAEGINIPPERRSARKPVATKHFGDVLSWKEANKHVNPLRPSAPGPSKW